MSLAPMALRFGERAGFFFLFLSFFFFLSVVFFLWRGLWGGFGFLFFELCVLQASQFLKEGN